MQTHSVFKQLGNRAELRTLSDGSKILWINGKSYGYPVAIDLTDDFKEFLRECLTL
jgi:hypothetical protein